MGVEGRRKTGNATVKDEAGEYHDRAELGIAQMGRKVFAGRQGMIAGG